LKSDLLSTQRGRSRQRRDMSKRPGQMGLSL